ncbi:unnamed protein product, partial [Scytosiphon promiscuus]
IPPAAAAAGIAESDGVADGGGNVAGRLPVIDRSTAAAAAAAIAASLVPSPRETAVANGEGSISGGSGGSAAAERAPRGDHDDGGGSGGGGAGVVGPSHEASRENGGLAKGATAAEVLIPGLGLVEEFWHNGVCLLHRPGTGNGPEGGIRRLVRCWGVDVIPGMTKSQLLSRLAQVSGEGRLSDNGCLSYSYELPAESVAAAAAAAAGAPGRAGVKVEEEGGDELGGGDLRGSEDWHQEGQVVWVRGAFVAFVDGKAIEDDDVWCPGVVCVNPDVAGGAGGSGGLVVDVMGQSKAEFVVGKDNLTGFPGKEEHLETVQSAVAEGLGDPPDHMCLAVAQAILACLKCGWDSERGTNLLRPSLCNDQSEGDERLEKYAAAWGVDAERLEDLLKYSWMLMRPVTPKPKPKPKLKETNGQRQADGATGSDESDEQDD